MTTSMEDIVEVSRKASEWASPRGLRKDIVPWRLWEKAKQFFWDPADLDFSQDAKDWAGMNEEQQLAVSGLARGFMVGEEGVTLDIVPLIIAMSDEGRTEEVMYLTTFAMEEAKHVDFFRRWFDAIGVENFDELDRIQEERLREAGLDIPDRDRSEGLFERELPRVMRRVLVDRSPQTVLDASVTYNQFIEGCLAISGYKLWAQVFEQFGVLPGMQEGLRLVRRDEGRHITYGTYLCRRIMAAHPELLEFAKGRMHELFDYYFQQSFYPTRNGEPIDPSEIEGPGAIFGNVFRDGVADQLERRIAVLETAAALSEETAETDLGAEEAELELETQLA